MRGKGWPVGGRRTLRCHLEDVCMYMYMHVPLSDRMWVYFGIGLRPFKKTVYSDIALSERG